MNISTEAQRVIQTLTQSGHIIANTNETIYHDGYDSDGPLSDIWDLYITCIDAIGQTHQMTYHRENWFDAGGDEGYMLTLLEGVGAVGAAVGVGAGCGPPAGA